jgi:hypothetical protein
MIIGNLWLVVYDERFMHKEFRELGVYGDVPNADEILSKIYGYFELDGGILDDQETAKTLDVKEFNEREIKHMEDVRDVVVFFKSIFYVCLTLFMLLVVVYLINSSDIISDIRQPIA